MIELAHGGGGSEDLIAGATLLVLPIAMAIGVLVGAALARKHNRGTPRSNGAPPALKRAHGHRHPGGPPRVATGEAGDLREERG